MCYRLLDCCLGVERHFQNATIIGALRRKNGNVTGWLVVLQTYYKKKKKWKIHLGGEEKERTKARAGEMMMMLSFALCTADHIPLRRGHYNWVNKWNVFQTPPPPARPPITDSIDIYLHSIWERGHKILQLFFFPASLLLACKIIAAFKISPPAYSKWAPRRLLPKEFSFHGQLSFLHLEETEPWHNYIPDCSHDLLED